MFIYSKNEEDIFCGFVIISNEGSFHMLFSNNIFIEMNLFE